jgi:hypothetical protein
LFHVHSLKLFNVSLDRQPREPCLYKLLATTLCISATPRKSRNATQRAPSGSIMPASSPQPLTSTVVHAATVSINVGLLSSARELFTRSDTGRTVIILSGAGFKISVPALPDDHDSN